MKKLFIFIFGFFVLTNLIYAEAVLLQCGGIGKHWMMSLRGTKSNFTHSTIT